MRLSLIFELLLIFILLAFVASKTINPKKSNINIRSVIKRQNPSTSTEVTNLVSNPPIQNADPENTKPPVQNVVAPQNSNPVKPSTTTTPSPPIRYCSCSPILCNCCREFALPLLGLRGPGCASLQYLNGDRMAISMSFGDRVLTNTTISGRRPQPVCMPLPGGVSRFCGRVYNIRREGEDFKACLGLELRSLADLEAALRVSCFRFGPDGLKVEPAQPLPTLQNENEDDDDDDEDDDDDDFGLGEDDDDDDDDDDDIDFDDEDDDDDDDGAANDVGAADYTPFSLLGDSFFDDIFDSNSGNKKKPTNKKVAVLSTTKAPPIKVVNARHPVRKTSHIVRRTSTTAAPTTQSTTIKRRKTTKPTIPTTTKKSSTASRKKTTQSMISTKLLTTASPIVTQKTTFIIAETTVAATENVMQNLIIENENMNDKNNEQNNEMTTTEIVR